jgi:hypothetical protein
VGSGSSGSPSSPVTGISSVVADSIPQRARMGECSGTYLGGRERSFYALRLRGRLEGRQGHQE